MHQITLTVSQNVLMNHIIQINNNFTACVQTVRQQHAHISGGRATGQSQPRSRSVQSQPKFASSERFAGHKCHKSLFRTRIATHHPKFNSLQVHFDESY